MVGSNHVMVRSIRSEIEYRIKSYNYTLSKLSELTNINAGHLSGFLKGNPIRALTIDQLNAIGRAFGEPTGWLYDLYVEECFQRGKVSKRRVRPYLVQCAELGRHDCIQMVIPQLLEDPKNIEVLFAVAEQLFYKGKQKESAYFYQLVVDNEKNSHSERSVISHYRLFRALLGSNAEENGKAVIRFEPFRKRLSEGHQLDALLQLANVSFTLHKWKEVEKYADELRELATLVYENEQNKQKSNRKGEPLKTERHLVVYYGQAYLLKSEALEKQGLYKKANEYAAGYADLGWFENLDEVGQKEVQKFRLWARGNRYTFDLLMGQLDILPDYIAFLEDNPKELLAGLVTIVESANKYDFSIDNILAKFSFEIGCFDEYQDTINVERHLRFRYQLAIYQFKNERFHNGIVETLRCLTLSTTTNDHKNFIRCVTLFEAHRYHATEQQKQDYKKIMEEVRNDESLFAFASNDLWVV
ncbi:DNA-binding protein [Brevibacillus laterosporus]|uniref:DNA-binding protein n=1 Tax=Brevibacillus laterosporus TaxID=1465 RepID=UPI0018F8A1FB|nr:DNA-binding protein [Brevibacillus laterosporus]MBG9772685.1 DNA-binding protein [Brevibacillus laterosporus]